MSETWLDKVNTILEINTKRVVELQRFVGKFEITNLRLPISPNESKPLAAEEAIKELFSGRIVHGNIGDTNILLQGWRRKNIPFLNLKASVEIEKRTIQLFNGLSPYRETANPETIFSDESHAIADSLCDILKMTKAVGEEIDVETDAKLGEKLIVTDNEDYIIVAYNTLISPDEDC